MSKRSNYRAERIERLFEELRYEIERGLMDNQIDEDMGYRFVFPISRKLPDGVVQFEAILKPQTRWQVDGDPRPRLRLVEKK